VARGSTSATLAVECGAASIALDIHLYGRNAKLLLSACVTADARSTGLYLHPKHRRSPRRSRKLSSL
jgi:hypothetical protein